MSDDIVIPADETVVIEVATPSPDSHDNSALMMLIAEHKALIDTANLLILDLQNGQESHKDLISSLQLDVGELRVSLEDLNRIKEETEAKKPDESVEILEESIADEPAAQLEIESEEKPSHKKTRYFV